MGDARCKLDKCTYGIGNPRRKENVKRDAMRQLDYRAVARVFLVRSVKDRTSIYFVERHDV